MVLLEDTVNFRTLTLVLCALVPTGSALAEPASQAHPQGRPLEAHAQIGVAAPAPGPSREQVEAGGSAREQNAEEPAEEDADHKDPMGWIGFGVKVGIGSIHSSDLAN